MNNRIATPYLFGLLLLIMLLSACGVKQFSDSSPFAVELGRARSYYQAQKLQQRLKKMDIPSYMVVLTDEMDQSSKWYVTMTGAEKDTIAASQLQIELDIKYKLKDLAVLNFNTVKKNMLPFDKKALEEIENINAVRPDLPENIYELIGKFPKSDVLNIENVSLFNLPKGDIPRSAMQNFYDAALDLPRGIGRNNIAQHAEAFAEVIYKDNLYGDQVTVDVLKLIADHQLQEKARAIQQSEKGTGKDAELIAWYFASMILSTGNYNTEEYEPIKVLSYTNLLGYKVTIEPRTGQLRTYMILVDMQGGFVIFSQSTQKTDQEILDYLADFGKSNGVLDYSEFHNTFFTIPRCLEKGDVFLGFHSEVLGNDYAYTRGYVDWSKAMVGHTVSTTDFYNTDFKVVWGCSAFDLLTYSKKEYIYNDMYRNHESAEKTPIKVNTSDGFYVQYYGVQEINYPTADRHVLAVDGPGLSKNALLQRAQKFQTGKIKVGMDPCKGQKPKDSEPTAEEPTPSDDPDDEKGEDEPKKPEPPTPKPEDEDPKPQPNPAPKPTPTCGEGQIVQDYPADNPAFQKFDFETNLGTGRGTQSLKQVLNIMKTQVKLCLPSADERAVKNCMTSKFDLTMQKGNPIVIKVDEEGNRIRAYSLPGHHLHPCWLERSLVLKNGKIMLQTRGETLSKKQEVKEWGNWFFWSKTDKLLQERVRGI